MSNKSRTTMDLIKQLLKALRAQWMESRLVATSDDFSPNNVRTLYISVDGVFIRRYAAKANLPLEQTFYVKKPFKEGSFEYALQGMYSKGYYTIAEYEENDPLGYTQDFKPFKDLLTGILTQKIMSALDEIYVDEDLVSGRYAPLRPSALLNDIRRRGANKEVSDSVCVRYIGIIPQGRVTLDEVSGVYALAANNVRFCLYDAYPELLEDMHRRNMLYINKNKDSGDHYRYVNLQEQAYPAMDRRGTGPIDRRIMSIVRKIRSEDGMYQGYMLFCRDARNLQRIYRLLCLIYTRFGGRKVTEVGALIGDEVRSLIMDTISLNTNGLPKEVFDRFVKKYREEAKQYRTDFQNLRDIYDFFGVFNISGSTLIPKAKVSRIPKNEGYIQLTEMYKQVFSEIKRLSEAGKVKGVEIRIDLRRTYSIQDYYTELNRILDSAEGVVEEKPVENVDAPCEELEIGILTESEIQMLKMYGYTFEDADA